MSRETVIKPSLYTIVGYTADASFSILMKVDGLKELLSQCEDGGMIRLTKANVGRIEEGTIPLKITSDSYTQWTTIPPKGQDNE